MFYYCVLLLSLFSMMLFGMEHKGSQLELCSNRKMYDRPKIVTTQKESVQSEIVTTKPCAFCNSDILTTNHILIEDKDHDVRVMMNKFPYFDFDQGSHLLIMPISHKEHPSEFSHKELGKQVKVVQRLAMQLYEYAYMQDFCANWGLLSGQSQPHWHSHFKSYVQPPMSLPEKIQCYKSIRINTAEEAFNALKMHLESAKNIVLPFQEMSLDDCECNCCSVKNDHNNDENNFVIARFKYNYVCLSHYPCWPGEISVVPNNHVAAIKDLSQEALQENMILAMALLPKMKEYAQAHIRECGGGNIYIKSIGHKASDEKKSKYHVHTLVIPRTTIAITPGGMEGTCRKFDCDPLHLFQYLKNAHDELKKIVT